MENKDINNKVDTFRRTSTEMIATNDRAYGWDEWGNNRSVRRSKDYTLADIEHIINSGSLDAQVNLSRNYFDKDGFYKRLITHYATLMKYVGILIPNPSFGKSLSTDFISKKYYNATTFIDNMHIPSFLENCALRALCDGAYFGVIITLDKKTFSVLDLPGHYCCSRFKDIQGNDIIEFNVEYFNTIYDKKARDSALAVYPEVISKHYRKYKSGKIKNKWVKIPPEIGVCFPFYDGRPCFLNVIPASINYDEAVGTERDRQIEEIKKILVQKVPHLQDGSLLFEPVEALEMHKGAVGMLKGNKNISVLTTYTDVDAIVSRTSSESAQNNLEKMKDNIYYESGTSSQLFGTNSNLALSTSLINDMAFIMPLIHKFETFITNIVNFAHSNSNINFKYTILPVTYYNEKDYIAQALNMANSGYSFLIPAIAMGLSQNDINNIKDLENDVLKLRDKFIPLMTSYTQSSEENKGGGQVKDLKDKSDKTAQNIEALDK